MNKQDAIEMLKSMLPEKISYAELIGASSCYGDGGLVYADPEPYAIETAISALEKQIPYQVDCISTTELAWKDGYCKCGEYTTDSQVYCCNCGQALDWSVEE